MSTLAEQSTEAAVDWHIDTVDVDAYLARLGIERPAKPTARALRDLATAHVLAIPFENVDVLLEQHRGISLDVVQEKLVGKKRGGYCYEHAHLFAAAAERLGFRVRRIVARVQPRRPGPYTHMSLLVEAEGVWHLVDVGFGAGMLQPMPLVDGAVVDQAGWPHRLTHREGWWTLQKQQGDEWEDLHAFTPNPSSPIDYEVYHHYTSTHPRSPFTGQLVVMRLEPGLSRQLVGHELTVRRPDGTEEKTEVAPGELGEALRQLDVALTPEELAALLERY
ncbi:arylamine N-acetyltransferase [Amycolatopsis sp. NPDC059027]|uniref:arylamine N-acetyltransferase family protein n=1 Tax=Amycolatopsis sp. NPDC059027 TaxID=3346709 RepID=UPI00366A9858